jgi:MYXO-CTERM domain-containing protein
VSERSTVGPYDVVEVHGTDEGAIVGWLRTHGYAVPSDIEPMLTQYVTEGFDFVAVRLRPDVGVRAMRPIRVTFPGAMTSLPLRMVAAGVGAQVGLKLFIVGDGRWHAANFDDFVIEASTLTWDFSLERSDYTAKRQILSDGYGGRAFALESSIDIYASSLPPGVHEDAGVGDADAEVDAYVDADTDADADADEATDATEAGAIPGIDPTTSDREIVFGTHERRRFTRLRGDLPTKYLDVDLRVEADTTQALLGTEVYVTHSSSDSLVCPKASPPATNPAPPPATYGPSHDGCQCDVESTGPATKPVIVGGLAVVLMAVSRRRIRRRRRCADSSKTW